MHIISRKKSELTNKETTVDKDIFYCFHLTPANLSLVHCISQSFGLQPHILWHPFWPLKFEIGHEEHDNSLPMYPLLSSQGHSVDIKFILFIDSLSKDLL